MRFTIVKRLPQPACGTLGGVQGGIGQVAAAREKANKFFLPDA